MNPTPRCTLREDVCEPCYKEAARLKEGSWPGCPCCLGCVWCKRPFPCRNVRSMALCTCPEYHYPRRTYRETCNMLRKKKSGQPKVSIIGNPEATDPTNTFAPGRTSTARQSVSINDHDFENILRAHDPHVPTNNEKARQKEAVHQLYTIAQGNASTRVPVRAVVQRPLLLSDKPKIKVCHATIFAHRCAFYHFWFTLHFCICIASPNQLFHFFIAVFFYY